MKKTKKILYVLISTIAVIAVLAINAFAFTGTGVGLYKLPNVSYYVSDRLTDGKAVSYARDTNFEALNDASASNYDDYLSVAGGDVTNSVRSRWKYDYQGTSSGTYHDACFILQSATNNPIYNISVDLQNYPFAYGMFDYSRIGLYQYNCYTVDNNFVYEPSFDVNNMQVSVLWTDCNVDPPVTRRTFLYDFGLQWGSYSSNIINAVLYHTGLSDYDLYELGNCFVNNISIQVDNRYGGYNASFVELYFYSEGFDFYRSLSENTLSDGRYAFNDLIGDLNYIAHQDGYKEGYDKASEKFDYYYDLGVEQAIEERGMFAFVIDSLEAFFSYPLFDLPNGGNISLGLLLGVILGALVFVWILKLIAGG